MSTDTSQPHATQRWLHASPFVGRTIELSQLTRCFEAALQGQRQFVFIAGEPGIGKTALVDAFLQQIQERKGGGLEPSLSPQAVSRDLQVPSVRLGRGQCIEHYGAGEAYLPLLEALSRLGRESEGEEVVAALAKYAPTWLAQLPILVRKEQALSQAPGGATRERMLREIAEALEALSTQQPLLLVLEDLHWSDPSTLELLAYLARRRDSARFVILSTYRPIEVSASGQQLRSVLHELQSRGQAATLRLSGLPAPQVAAYLTARFGIETARDPRFQQLAHTVHQRTEGTPLFMVTVIEQLARDGVIIKTPQGWRVREERVPHEVGVPESVRHLIERHLERLRPEDQRMLEVASVAGMEFGAAAVAAGMGLTVEKVEEQCENLVRKEQFVSENGMEEWPDGALGGRYRFQHALYHEVVYARLTEVRRIQLHRRIAECKETAYGKRASEIAAELAIHFEAGRALQQAIRYYGQAGRNAVRRQAHREAMDQLSKGLALLQRLPETSERAERELSLQLALGNSLVVTKGYAAPEVEQVYARALELCQRAGETPHLIPALFGLCAFYLARAELQTGLSLTERTLHLARQGDNQEILMAAHATRGIPLYWRGEIMQACAHWEQALALYNPQQDRLQSGVQDFGVLCLCYQAVARWQLGYPDQAREYSRKALALAQQLAHPFSEGWALYWAGRYSHCVQDNQTVGAHAETLFTLATEYGFAHLTAYGAIQKGWVFAMHGRTTEGVAQIQHSLQELRTLGSEIGRPYFLTLLADAWRQAGDLENGLGALTEALAIAPTQESVTTKPNCTGSRANSYCN